MFGNSGGFGFNNNNYKAESAVHGCHRPGDMAVRMRKVLAKPWVGVRVCHLLLLLFGFNVSFVGRASMLVESVFET